VNRVSQSGFTMDTNEDWLRLDREFVIQSGGVRPTPVLVEGSGCKVRDVEGNEFLDFTSGQMCAALGHSHPKIVQAIREQSGRLMHTNSFFTTVPAIELARELAKIMPRGLRKSIILNTGAESVEVAYRIAKLHTGKWEIAALTKSFHGSTAGAVSTTFTFGRKGFGPTMPGVFAFPTPYCYRCPAGLEYPDCDFGCLRFGEEMIRASTTGSLAAFIAEPILSAGGVIVPPEDYFVQVKKLCDELGMLLILDEAQTGYGRLGKMFGCETFNVVPEIMATSKSLGAGAPVAATTTTDAIARDIEAKGFLHITSHLSDPLPSAVALASVRAVQEEHLPERAAKMGEYLSKSLIELSEDFKLVGEVRGKGLLIGVELVRDRRTKEPADDEGARLVDLCMDKGLIIGIVRGKGMSSVLRIAPPLVVTSEEIDKAVEIIWSSLKEL